MFERARRVRFLSVSKQRSKDICAECHNQNASLRSQDALGDWETGVSEKSMPKTVVQTIVMETMNAPMAENAGRQREASHNKLETTK